MLTLRQIRYFAAIVEAGGFTKAAGHLNIAQSALSLHIRRLEQDFGVELLTRSSTGVQPTPAGSVLMDHAAIILRQLTLAERDLQALGEKFSDTISIGIPSGASRVLVAPLLASCKQHMPGVSLQIVEAMTGHLEEWLRLGRIDMAILYAEPGPEPAAGELLRERFYLISSAAESDSFPRPRLADLAEATLALPTMSHSTRRCLTTAAERLGISLEVEFEVDSLASIIDMVKQGRAFSILTPDAFLQEWRQGEVAARMIVDPPVERSVVLAHRPLHLGEKLVGLVVRNVEATAKALVRAGEWPEDLEGMERLPRARRA